MTGFYVAPAVRTQRTLKACLYGMSNGGKTLTALLIMRGLIGDDAPMVVLDTEYRRSQLYQGAEGVGNFEILDMSLDENQLKVDNPYTDTRYIAALEFLEERGFQGIIVDSLTPVWKKPGGILDQHKNIAAKEKYKSNTFSAWQETDVLYWGLIDAINAVKPHVICTLRASEEWIMEKNEKGREAPVRHGVKPEFRGGITYEFDLFAKMRDRGIMEIETWRILEDLPDYAIERPGPEFIAKMLGWLSGAPPIAPMVEQSLAIVQKAMPAWTIKTPNWKTYTIAKALNIVEGEEIPTAFTEEQRWQINEFALEKKREVERKKQEKLALVQAEDSRF